LANSSNVVEIRERARESGGSNEADVEVSLKQEEEALLSS
jgi:hypothetical protein